MAGDDVTITIRADSGQAVRAMRDATGQLRDMRGRFASEGSIMSNAMRQVSASVGGVTGSLIPLASAAVPLAAALGPVAAKSAAAGVAVAAFGAAVAGQVSALSEASKAQETYTDAVAKHGRGSAQAAQAQRAVQQSLAGMPAATQRASVALTTLKDGFQDWSDSLASFTMAPVEKSFTVLGQVVPKLTGMAKGASTQLDRLVTVAGGAIATPGFDALTEKLTVFANEALRDAVDGVIHFMRVASEGNASGPLQSFIEYANANGPALRETLSSVGDAVSTLVEAAAEAGPGMLTLVNAAAQMVAALPPELVATVMQLAVALKLVTLAGAGVTAASTAIAALSTRIVALRAASTAAGGGLAGLGAAFATLGKAAKASVIVAGIAALVVAVNELSGIGKEAPPNVDRLTTSLGELGRTGMLSGEAARVLGDDFGKLHDVVSRVADPSVSESFANWGADISGGILRAGDSTEELIEKMDSVDEALTNLVRNGNADLAAAAIRRMTEGMSPEEIKEFNQELDNHKQALKDAQFEADIVADSMGIFGQAAQDTTAKLEAQKGAADGLRQSILALNEVNRSAYSAQISFEAGLDSLTESFQKHGATLNIDTEAGRANGQAMMQAAAAQDELIASGLAAGESLESMAGKSEKLRDTMMRLATDAFDGNIQKATEYVNTLLGVPNEIKTLIVAEQDEAIAGLQSVQAAIKETPGSKVVTVDTLNGAAIMALEAVGLKTKALPDGRTQVYTANGQALGSIDSVRKALEQLNGKRSNTYTTHTVTTHYRRTGSHGASLKYATGGKVIPGYADGGDVLQVAPEGLISGPGTGTSDSITAVFASGAVGRVSDTEFVVNARATRKHLPLLEAINEGRLGGYASGGQVEARKNLAGRMGISHFGRAAGYQTTTFERALGKPQDVGQLVSSLNELRGQIKGAFSGRSESGLLRSLDKAGRSLLAHEKRLTDVNKSLEKARTKLDGLRDSAKQLSSGIASKILGEANITSGGPRSLREITDDLTASRDKSQALSGALATLKKRGLDKNLLREIAEAGTEGGGLETAQSLMGASPASLKHLATLRSQIDKYAKASGATASDAMYGAGLRAAEGLVKGLTAKQDSIEAAMMKIAKSMEKSIKKALGIRSPSKVMEEVGQYTADGFAQGMSKNRSIRPAWQSMLNVPRTGTGSGRATGGGPVELVIHSGGSRMDDLLVEVLRKAVRVRGGNVQLVLGKG